ncbi:hypothetical protein [Acutalibacter muris]|uniref:hypothetical protein n=1 Tax=Acutalibacter muris TaxID=1796620 RepID=UPI00272C7C1F|nr:hypothetical protein [Acutalibacter muris]
MKKQYVISFRNTNIRLSQTIRYLVNVQHGRATKTTELSKAMIFSTKATAREAIASISKNNLYNTEVNIILK